MDRFYKAAARPTCTWRAGEKPRERRADRRVEWPDGPLVPFSACSFALRSVQNKRPRLLWADTGALCSAMGILSLSKHAKSVGSLSVNLQHAEHDDRIVVDGGFLLHRCCTKGGQRHAIYCCTTTSPRLSKSVLSRSLSWFESRGFKVTVVLDGSTPPAKKSTSEARRTKREAAASEARELQRTGGRLTEINKKASVFDSLVVARVATLLRPQIAGEVYIAPREADPQIVIFQDIYLETGVSCVCFRERFGLDRPRCSIVAVGRKRN